MSLIFSIIYILKTARTHKVALDLLRFGLRYEKEYFLF